MATGVSKGRWTGSLDNTGRAGSAADEIQLSYAGKTPEAHVMATPPGVFTALPRTEDGATTNHLYYGENLGALAHLLHDPAVAGQVRLIYIDPPYATNSVFQSRTLTDAYADLMGGAQFIEFLRKRLILLRELLAVDGSIYVHLDQKMAFQAKILLDEVFGAKNFRGIITRRKCNPKNSTSKTYGNISDYLLFYSKTDDYVWNRPYEPWTATREAEEYPYVEQTTGRRFKKVPVHAPGVRNGETGEPWRGKLPPPGKHWQYRPSELDAMDARGEIYWSPTGNPRRKLYLDVSKGLAVQDIWWELRDAHNQMVRITGYPTEKNPALLERLIRASSNAGDLVLDCFAGSGTTLVVADQLDRRWIGMDNSEEALRTIFQRFTHGSERMGDFVSRPPAVPVRRQVAPSLFDPAPDEPAALPAATPGPAVFEHPITEFACHCAPELLSADIRQLWEANQARTKRA